MRQVEVVSVTAGVFLSVLLSGADANANHAAPPPPRFRHIANATGIPGVTVRAYLQSTEERVWGMLTDLSRPCGQLSREPELSSRRASLRSKA